MDGLTVGTVTARNVGESGLLLNETINATIGTVDAQDAGAGTGYAAFRMANRNGRVGSSYPTNIRVGTVIARGGGRGIFCVSESGGAVIDRVDIANTGNNSILIENCYNVTIAGAVRHGHRRRRGPARRADRVPASRRHHAAEPDADQHEHHGEPVRRATTSSATSPGTTRRSTGADPDQTPICPGRATGCGYLRFCRGRGVLFPVVRTSVRLGDGRCESTRRAGRSG